MTGAKNAGKRSNQAARNAGSAKRILLVLIGVVVLAAIAAFGFWRQKDRGSDGPQEGSGLFAVKRGDLAITVTESGSIKAVKTVDIKSQVEGQSSIVNIVPEGTLITPEDVNNGKVLVELDSSKLKEQLSQREIDLTAAEASYKDANESFLIQVKQNESDISAAALKVKFASMDLQKYLGKTVAETLVAKAGQEADPNMDITSLLDDPNSLGGEASQKLRELQGNISLAQSNLKKAAYTLDWTKKLFEKQYVAETELQKDTLDHQRLVLDEEKARIALRLFELYEFAKQSEQLLSDCREAKRGLERAEARARAQLAQAKAKLSSVTSTYEMQKQRLEKLHTQIEACTIRAPAPGQVVYWSSTEQWVRIKIEQGAQVPEGYKIITIPDASKMKVEVKIHETWIDKIEPNQPAEITVEAFPDKTFTGKVLKKAPLADAENWLNPDLKVYSTDIGIDGTHDALKTGMTGKVTVIINKLQDVLYVPIQSVVTVEDKKVCYVAASPAEKREVETGLFNDNFVEIKSGLSEGEKVLLNPPKWAEPQGQDKSDKSGKPDTSAKPDGQTGQTGQAAQPAPGGSGK